MPPSQIPDEVRGTIDRQNGDAPGWARLAGQQRPASPALLAEWEAKHAAALAAWAALRPWKRLRWSLCALRNASPFNPPDGHDGLSGFGLYWGCYLAQDIQPGAQPISPCARRTYDPSASPFDYTP